LAFESLDPRLDGFAVPDWPALQPLKRLREMIAEGPPAGHALLGQLCNSGDFSDFHDCLLGHYATPVNQLVTVLGRLCTMSTASVSCEGAKQRASQCRGSK